MQRDGPFFFNTKIASAYLVKGKKDYQGEAILWRRYLSSPWRDLKECIKAGRRVTFPPAQAEPEQLTYRIRRFIRAMDCVARTKVREIIPIFEGLGLEGEILDVGAGSGAVAAAFLERFPSMRATLMDLPEVLDYAEELMRERWLTGRVTYCQANILEAWPVRKGCYDLVILSNLIHTYAENEVTHILARAAECLKADGFLVIHDFFREHYPEKAALFDLNMLINTYNGKVFAQKWVREKIENHNLYVTHLIPLATDTALIIGSKNKKKLEKLSLDPKARLVSTIQTLGFRQVCLLPVKDIHVPEWPELRCQFGCDLYGKPHCPPNSPSPQRTRDILKDYTLALLLEGEPPTRSFQRRVLQAEKEAFKAGFYKAFAFWAGPCSLCDSCTTKSICHNTRDARPSMEGAGIDVFETARRAGLSLRTLNNKNDFVKYFALVLLE